MAGSFVWFDLRTTEGAQKSPTRPAEVALWEATA